jgi:N-acetylmuramoyl-L-alanine amidase
MEKTYTLDVSLRLRKLLEAAGYKVVLTRDSDDLSKPSRAEIANRCGRGPLREHPLQLAPPDTKTTGVEVMLLSPGSHAALRRTPGARGKKDDAEDKAAGERIRRVERVLGGGAPQAPPGGDPRRRPRREVRAPRRPPGLKCPGVLVEPAFISSDAEGAKLGDPGVPRQDRGAILAGIQDYAAEIRRCSPGGTRRPEAPRPRGAGAQVPADAPRGPVNRPDQGLARAGAQVPAPGPPARRPRAGVG